MQSDSADRDDDEDSPTPRPRFVSHTELRMPCDETPAPPPGPAPKTLPSTPPPPPSDRRGHISDDEAVSVVRPGVPVVQTSPALLLGGLAVLLVTLGIALCIILQGLPQHAH